jgi:hypothetical protein
VDSMTCPLTRPLLPFCDVTLLRGRVQVGDADFTVEIEPKIRAVILWEEYESFAQ